MKRAPIIELLESRTLLAALDDSETVILSPSWNDSVKECSFNFFTKNESLPADLQYHPSPDIGISGEQSLGTRSATTTPNTQAPSSLSLEVSEDRAHRFFLTKLQTHLEANAIDDPKFEILIKRWSDNDDSTTRLQEKIEIAKRMGHGFLTHGYAINTGYVISLTTPLVIACEHSEVLLLKVNAGSTLVAILCAGLEILDHNFNEALGEAKIDAYEDAMERYDQTLTIIDQINNESFPEGTVIIEQTLQDFNSHKSSYVLGKDLDAEAESGEVVSKAWGYIALSSLGNLFVERNVAKVALAKLSTTPGEMYEDLSIITRYTALPLLSNIINLSNSLIATVLLSRSLWVQYDNWVEYSETSSRALTLSQQCDNVDCNRLDYELSLVAHLIAANQQPSSPLIGMGWSSLKLTAMLSSIVPTLASLGFAYHGQVSFAQKLTTWAYLLGSAGFVAQGIAEAGLYYASDLFWSGSTERDDASSAESALKHELSKTFDTGRADESTIIEEKMNDLLKYDKNFAVEFLLHHLARERSEFLQKKLARNPEFKPSDLALKEIEGPVTRFLKHFDHVISDEDLLALFHYSGEADAEALLRRRLHV